MANSIHARRQAQRRGISQEYAELIGNVGDEIKSNRSCHIRRISHTEMDALKYDNPTLWRRYRDKKAVSVNSDTGVVVTLKHQYRILWRNGMEWNELN